MSWNSFIVDKTGLLLDENKLEDAFPNAAWAFGMQSSLNLGWNKPVWNVPYVDKVYFVLQILG